MKTTKIKMKVERLAISGLVIAMLLLAGTVQAVDYKSTYRSIHSQSTFGIATTATAPSATFQSTSAYSSQWANSSGQSMLNADGSVNSGAYLTSGPHRAKKEDDDIPNPPDPEDPEKPDPGNVPLGEGLFLLALLAAGYAARKRTSILES